MNALQLMNFGARKLKENKITSVIHYAALKSVEDSIIDPIKYYETNVSGTISLLNAMKETNNPTNVHLILNFSVFITLFLTGIFLKLDNIDLVKYIIGVIFILIGLYYIRES